MRYLNLFIVCSYIFGLSVGEFISDSSAGLLWSFCCTTTSSVVLLIHSFLFRDKLTPRLFNTLFLSLVFISFASFGLQRAKLLNNQPQGKIELFILDASERAKERFGSIVQEVFAPSGVTANEKYLIVKALLVGDKRELSKEVKQNFRIAGVSHTLALSGLHVGIVWSFFSLILFFLGFSIEARKIRIYLIMLLIFSYAFITGLSNSVVRAAIMLSIWQLNRVCGRRNSGVNSIVAAAFIILLINPSSLHSVSFQLSFAAVFGISILYSTINESIIWLSDSLSNYTSTKISSFANPYMFIRKYLVNPLGGICKKAIIYLLQLMGISIACQIFTMPVILYYFGGTSQHFLISNLAVIPSVTLAVYSSALTLIVALCGSFSDTLCGSFCGGEFFAPIVQALAALTTHIVDWLLSVVQFLSV